jgi:lipopolysaccharide transport system ATP-binding protein
MAKPIIEIDGVGKKYRIGGNKQPYLSLREELHKKLPTSYRCARNAENDFWALKDISFSVNEGEAVGIIGRNGAGKSTLLKILSQITPPTEGKVIIRGRVASLLEVGTGFHPELTGRENIFLNGAILGMTRAEIKGKFDEIVAFAEIEKFLDTPVKRYSSGMYVRLAFAVAAHLDPEILLVDEVLAVGDAQFQKKCLGKMNDVSKEGRTVLFVSHNMTTITRLCARGICLHEGRVIMDDDAPTVVHKYLSSDYGTTAYRKWEDLQRAPGNDTVRLLEMQVNNGDQERCETVDITKHLDILMKYSVLQEDALVRPFLICYNDEGVCLFTSTDFFSSWYGKVKAKGIYVSKMTIPGNFLAEGNMLVSVGMGTGAGDGFIFFVEDSVLSFTVIDSMSGKSARKDNPGAYPGVVRPVFNWDTIKV